jgi:tRNA threonylcarbamoyl adenosine modification protein (Sua5/YciO/YrdC/YwlC family)
MDADGLASAAFFLRAGEPVVIPTDTVYGVAVDPTLPGATQRLFDLKGRGRDVPIAVLVADDRQAWSLAAAPVPPAALDLAAAHWPGPLTLVVRRATAWDADLGDETETIGVRCPGEAWVRSLCAEVGPLATSSANRHGEPTPRDAAGVAELFEEAVGLVVDGGASSGTASTVVDCLTDPPSIVRAGALSAADLWP